MLDLRDSRALAQFLATVRPDAIFLAAAKVGGIWANDAQPAEFIRDNLVIQANVIHEAAMAGVKSLLFYGSSCMYPRDAAQPIREDQLLAGKLETTNRPYGVAKIAGVELCWAYNRQHATRFLCVVPAGVYGPGDNYDLRASHVLPALIRRFHEAKERGDTEVTLWGTGAPLREFLHCDDLAAASIYLMELDPERLSPLFAGNQPPLINIGGGIELSIMDLAERVRELVGAKVDIVWDKTKPDGTPRKALDAHRLSNIGWHPTVDFDVGLRTAYADFLDRRVRT